MEKKQSKRSYILVAALSSVLTLLLVFTSLCAFAGGFDNLKRGAKLAQILHIVKDTFVVEADLDAATDLAATGIIQSLEDKWSYYLTDEQFAQQLMAKNNSYRGIGVTISACEEGMLVADVNRDSPAHNAGILPGDRLTAINGESMAGWTTSQLQEKIASYGDESFTLTVLSEDGTYRDLTISTAEVYSSPVSYEMIGDTGYIVLENFSTGCSADGISAIDELIEQGAQALVFDVRYNGGGYVHEMTALLDYLLPEGEIFFSRSRDGKESSTQSDPDCIELPMAVLINEGSYSAAELFAAQLSEYGVAVTVGEASTGKGRSQASYKLLDGSAIHISQEVYLTSQGRDLAAEGGLTPDIEVPLDDEEKTALYYKNLPHDADRQLTAAIEAINDMA